MFNERSCIACHTLGGSGGAGGLNRNVELLTAKPPADAKQFSQFLRSLRSLHPAFAASTSIVLHRASIRPDYQIFRGQLLGLLPADVVEAQELLPTIKDEPLEKGPVKVIDKGRVTLLLSQRNTTPLFGLAAIDSISKEEIEKTIAVEHHEDGNVTGRFVGRFGWRGQVADLRGFVLGACAVEIGLQSKDHPAPIGPGIGASADEDLTPQQCDDLVAFVAALPAPIRANAKTLDEETGALRGEHLFHSTGCAVCHRPQLGTVFGVYSDLLVHDMGTILEDPAPASSVVSTQYYGPPPDLNSPLAAQRRREWKTPPLWGLSDSGPYLHDGRAKTIHDAILAHGGEAKRSLGRYQRLTPTQQRCLSFFLSTLQAPNAALLAGLGKAPAG
jgi:CxxC motif-containing protein (DUF1111 family)